MLCSRIIEVLVLLSIGISIFFMPIMVYAAEADTTVTYAAVSETQEEFLNNKPPAPNEPSVISGQTEPAISTAAAFTPDGQATVIDYAIEDSGKEFYSFSTPDGNVFYLVIDHARTSNNVYFLSAVTESDLIALSEKIGNPISESAVPLAEKPAQLDRESDEITGAAESADTSNNTSPENDKSGNTGMVIFFVLAVIALGGAGYYIKILRPKRQTANDDDELEDDDNDNIDDNDYSFEDDEDKAETEMEAETEESDEYDDYYGSKDTENHV